ncbi:phytanoyl-CoA dioxygenase family protein [Oscillatoria acuminata]|uniref:UbiA prenyltransferase family protein,methyltransferase family protein n=1 Tax=Oscillatoria acuminata PCC 6304 TaxID=56110 RepID=K9TU26_9CYAN|nr:phytanoyl-CoA dioxygenase family protein [Oscillatoria acuminata]AFY85514.1 UbiA prenyltransferase family protein,methyltransferase family protein [Oscillatoria acuminata PCC 6304]
MKGSHIHEIYDQTYAQRYNEKFIFRDCHADFEESVIKDLLCKLDDRAKWLDVACGTGYFLSRFPDGERCGLDFSSAMLDVARKDNPGVKFIQGDFRDKRLHWEGKWDLVSCMWWAYSYVESLPELEQVIENLACWTSDRGALFLPVGNPEVVTVGEVSFPYTIKDVGVYGGKMKLEGLIWTWIDEESNKRHEHLIAPHIDYLTSFLSRYFDRVDIIEYPEFKTRKAIIAREKKKQITTDSGNGKERGKALSVFSESTRIKNWWNYKIPPLLGIVYALLLLSDYTIAQATTIFAVIISTSIGAAGYGHFINDICDIETDQKANKPNAAANLQPWQRLLLCLLFLSIGFAAPLLTHLGIIPLALLTANYLLPTLYSVPPLRLKERGTWGILSDAAGAHLVPTLFVAATVLSQTPDPPRNALIFTGIAAAHAFFVGLRGILLHQLWDRTNDLNSGTATFVTQQPPKTVHRWIDRLVFPVEILLLSGVALLLCQSTPALTIFFAVYLLLTTVNIKTAPHPFTPSPPKGQNIIPHDLYEVWLPLALSITLAVQNPQFLLLVALTAMLFYPSIKVRITEMFQVIKAGFTPTPHPTPSPSDAPRPTPSTVAPLTLTMQQQLETEGYVVLENFLTPDELEDLREFDRTHPLPEDMAASEKPQTLTTSDLTYRKKFGDKFKSIAAPKLKTIIPGYRTVFCPWFRKTPNSKNNPIHLHQDPSFTDETQYSSLGIWCPLNDVNVESSCLCIVKGSHQLNLQKRNYNLVFLPYDQNIISYIENNYLTPVSLKEGQAILFDKRLIHGSPSNTSNIERVAATCFTIIPDEAPLYCCYKPSKELKQLEIYEVDDDFYNRYIYGEKPHGDGVTLIKTEPYTYDPLTPELIAEKLDPLHPDRTISRLKTQLAEQQRQHQTERDTLQQQLQETQTYLEQSCSQLQRELTASNEQLHQKTTELATLQQQLQETQTHLEESRSQRQRELTASNEQLHQKTTELATLKEDYSQTQTQLEHLREQLQTTQTKLQQTQTELERQRTQLQETQAKVAQLKLQQQQTQSEIQQSQEQLQQTQAKLQISERQQQQMQTLLEESQAELTEKTAELNQIKSEQHQARLAEIIRRRL